MRALQHGADAPGFATPVSADHSIYKDETPRLAGAGGFTDEVSDNLNFRGAGLAAQALHAINGEGKAAQYLARLHAQQADPDELAFIVAELYGAALAGFCRVVARAIGGAV